MTALNTNSNIADLDFETALKELEEITRKLESGDTKLEDSITLYERGSALKTHCEAKLAAAQMRVEKIIESNGKLSVEQFEQE